MAAEQAQPQQKKEAPAYGRPIQQIISDLSAEISPALLKEKTLGGKSITFLPWYQATRLLDFHAPGWFYDIKRIDHIGDQVVVTVRISIPAAEGLIYRDATGISDDEVKGYGDMTSNAESMALRRAAAKFGLGRYLYIK